MGAVGYGWFAEEKYQNTQIEIIRSRAVAQAAFQKLGLQDHPMFKAAADPVAAFQGMIQVEPRRETGLIEISISGPDRNEIARWVNAAAEEYVALNLEKAQENARGAVSAIEKLINPLRSELSEAQKERFQILQEKRIYNPKGQEQIVTENLTKLNASRRDFLLQVTSLQSVLSKVREIQSRGGDPLSIPELAKDLQLSDLARQRLDLQRQLESAKVTYRPGHPVYQQKRQELDKVERAISDQVKLSLTKMQNEYELAVANEAKVREEIRRVEDMSYQLGVATSQVSLAESDADTKKQLYDLITKRMQEVALGAELLANNVSILDHAIPPLHSVKPRRVVNLLVGAMIGMLFGLGVVFFLEYLDNTFRTPEELERALGLTTLASVPRYQGTERGERAVREAYQTLRTSLIFSSKGRQRKVVLVTSTAPQEGKSSTVASLARALAGAGERVLVVDCDLRRPTQHVHLNVDRDRGLTNYLVSSSRDGWSSFLKTVGPVNLQVLSCGPIPPNPPDLLGSDRFAALLHEVREAYDWVLLDSPPSASLSDAVLLSSMADMVVVVVRHNATDRAQVVRSVSRLRNVNAALVGVILNNVDSRKSKDDYYSGYYLDDPGDGRKGGVGRSDARASTGTGA
jgi:capsular exopolysaccharide synthesis family protein